MPAHATTTQRGYGANHQKLRKQLEALVRSGQAVCTEPVCLHRTRTIRPNQPWDLAHTPDKQGYRGPAHPRCNRAEGAHRGNALKRARKQRRLPAW